MVLRCGVGVPSALTPTSTLQVINDVDWLPEELSAGYLFTTVGRTASVEVSVPDAHRPEANALVDLAAAIGSRVPVAST